MLLTRWEGERGGFWPQHLSFPFKRQPPHICKDWKDNLVGEWLERGVQRYNVKIVNCSRTSLRRLKWQWMAAFLKFVSPSLLWPYNHCFQTKPVAYLRRVWTKVRWQAKARQLPKTTIALSPPYICHRLHLIFVTGDTLYLSQVEKKLAQPTWSPSEPPAETYCSARPPCIPTCF